MRPMITAPDFFASGVTSELLEQRQSREPGLHCSKVASSMIELGKFDGLPMKNPLWVPPYLLLHLPAIVGWEHPTNAAAVR